ncbi:MAG: CDP-diacylglycerol--serine O-phosphatidyltransferase [Syntrophaceae bacterium]
MKRDRFRMKRNKTPRTVPFLPNFVTTIGLFFGFNSLHFSLMGNFYMAAVMIFLAAFIDAIDGRIARATNSTSAFGKEYDSLSDVICFGVAPAIMIYLWELKGYGRLGFLACFLFVACGALRLARFNTDASGDNTKFTGLPIPVAAAAMASVILLSDTVGAIPDTPILIGVYCLSFLMVSTIKYPSFKHVEYIKAHPFQLLVAGLLLVVVIASAPEIMAFALTMTFVVGGLLLSAMSSLFSRKKAVNIEHEPLPGNNHHS